MAADGGRPAGSVAQRLYTQTHAFEFGQALAVLQKLYPHGTPPGHGVDPRQETVRLSGPLSAEFATSALGPLQGPAVGETQPHLPVKLFGLGGPDGPLPYAWQEWLQLRRARKDHAPLAFLDLFHQRLLGQLFRSDGKYRVAAPFAGPAASPVQPLLRALSGLLPQALHERQAVPDAALLARTAILADRRRSVSGFQLLVQGEFGVSLRISQFDGGWSALPSSVHTRLGRSGSNNRLGAGTLAGSRIWDEHAGIRITLGPLALATYQSFLPGGARHAGLMALAAFYFGIDMQVRLVLQLQDGQLPAPRLGKNSATRLGWMSWLASSTTPRHHQCVLQPGIETLA